MTTIVLEKAFYPQGKESAPVGWTEPSESSFPLNVPPSSRKKRSTKALKARRAIDISLIQAQDGQWIADEKVTLQFGVGTAPNEATADLMGTLADYREVLRARRYLLAPYLQQHLAWLELALD